MPYTNIFYTLNDSVYLMTVVTPRQHYGKAYESVGAQHSKFPMTSPSIFRMILTFCIILEQ